MYRLPNIRAQRPIRVPTSDWWPRNRVMCRTISLASPIIIIRRLDATSGLRGVCYDESSSLVAYNPKTHREEYLGVSAPTASTHIPTSRLLVFVPCLPVTSWVLSRPSPRTWAPEPCPDLFPRLPSSSLRPKSRTYHDPFPILLAPLLSQPILCHSASSPFRPRSSHQQSHS